MPIRTKPFGLIVVDDVTSLMNRQVREDRTLDYKGALILNDSGKLDLVQDVTAMANASGGTIIYGAFEGKGDDRGRIVEIRGMELETDPTELLIANLLRDGIDERIYGVEHRAIKVGDGTYLYVIRVPASPRAPHMVKLASSRPRFYMRATTSNDPMNAQQIREVALRTESAYDRATTRIARRIDAIKAIARTRPNIPHDHEGIDFVALHVLPLFPPRGGLDLSSRALHARWREVESFGVEGRPTHVPISFDGISAENSEALDFRAWTMLLREGGVEFAQLNVADLYQPNASERRIDGVEIEQSVITAMQHAKGFAEEGLLSLPIVVSLQLHNLSGLVAYAPRMRPGRLVIRREDVPIPPVEVHAWDDVEEACRGLFNTMWQTWGAARSPSYDDDGGRLSLQQIRSGLVRM